MTGNTGALDAPADVFAAANLLDDLWNSSARAVGVSLLEWQCNTWGSGCGRGMWEQVATFTVVAELLGLTMKVNVAGRDELVVVVPLHLFPAVWRCIEQLGLEVEDWPWLLEEHEVQRTSVAAEVLGVPVETLNKNPRLLEVLRLQ